MLDSHFQSAGDLHVASQGSSWHLSENSLRYFADQTTLWTGFQGHLGWSPVLSPSDPRSVTFSEGAKPQDSQGPSCHYSLSGFSGCLQPRSCAFPVPCVMYLPALSRLVLILLLVELKAIIWKELFSSLGDWGWYLLGFGKRGCAHTRVGCMCV